MSIFHCEGLQYSDDRKGPFKIYVFSNDGFHLGGAWFRKGPMRYPDEEITIKAARHRCDKAIAEKREVRICDGGDMLVYHSLDGKCIYGEGFWAEIGGQR